MTDNLSGKLLYHFIAYNSFACKFYVNICVFSHKWNILCYKQLKTTVTNTDKSVGKIKKMSVMSFKFHQNVLRETYNSRWYIHMEIFYLVFVNNSCCTYILGLHFLAYLLFNVVCVPVVYTSAVYFSAKMLTYSSSCSSHNFYSKFNHIF